MTEHPVAEIVKRVIDGGSLVTLALSLFQFLPAATAALTAVWICFRIRETRLNAKLIQAQIDELQRPRRTK